MIGLCKGDYVEIHNPGKPSDGMVGEILSVYKNKVQVECTTRYQDRGYVVIMLKFDKVSKISASSYGIRKSHINSDKIKCISLKDFVTKYVSHNSIIQLYYQTEEDGFQPLGSTIMAWKTTTLSSPLRYLNVLTLISVVDEDCPDAIAIVVGGSESQLEEAKTYLTKKEKSDKWNI